MLLVTIDKFDLNLVLININKMKPYWFVEDSMLQPILTNLSDMLTKELVEKQETNHMLDKELVEEEHVLFTTQPNNVSIKLVISVITLLS
jgi:uncharacterized circularly permuted ATP-grasp superfamily protein